VGPLSNPTGAGRQVVGVYSERLVEPLAHVLKNLGVKRAFVVHGLEGLDEVSVCGETLVGEVLSGEVKVYTVSPEEMGLKRWRPEELGGGDCRENLKIFEKIAEGEEGAPLEFLLANAAFALLAADRVSDLKEGVELARETVKSGRLKETVRRFVELSHMV
jgi:anthranilate phosphoribosyltransferase